MEKEIQQAIDLLIANGYEVTPPQTDIQINEEFERWWNMYNKKRGREKCLKRWLRLTKKDRTACINATPAYVRSITVKQYQKDPFTYLNQRGWEDEIIDEYEESANRTAIEFATRAANIFNSK